MGQLGVLAALVHLLFQHLDAGLDDAQRVAHFVGDAGDQFAEAGKLVGAQQLLGEVLDLGQVLQGDDDADRLAAAAVRSDPHGDRESAGLRLRAPISSVARVLLSGKDQFRGATSSAWPSKTRASGKPIRSSSLTRKQLAGRRVHGHDDATLVAGDDAAADAAEDAVGVGLHVTDSGLAILDLPVELQHLLDIAAPGAAWLRPRSR